MLAMTCLHGHAKAATSIPPQLEFDLNPPNYDTWLVRTKVNDSSLAGHLDIPSTYTGRNVNNAICTFPVTVIAGIYSQIKTVHIPTSITEITDNGFASPNLISVVIPNSVKSVGIFAFKSCPKLSSVVLSPNNNCTSSFSGCDIKKGAYPVGKRSFVADIEVAYPSNCIPDSAGLIFNPEATAFYFAPWNIKSLELPASVSTLGPKTLAGCTSLQTLAMKSVIPPAVSNDSFNGAIIKSITVPYGTKNAYINAPGWSDFASVITEVAYAESITLDSTEATLKATETIKLIASVQPAYTTESVTWSSSDESVATVDQEGNVTAIAIGKASIKATCGSVSASCLITVVPTEATNIYLSQSYARRQVNETVKLSATVIPETTTDKTVTWSSSDTRVASVSTDGTVTAKAIGSAYITATCGKVSNKCQIDVVETPAESIIIDKTGVKMKAAETLQLKATVIPETTTDKTVTWSSSDQSVATVDANGLVTAVAPGKVFITATCGKVNASSFITVEPTPASTISLDRNSVTLKVSENAVIKASVLPETTTDKSVTWTSSDESVATVDGEGTVTAIAVGNATVTASCGEISAKCEIDVVKTPVTAILLNNSEIILKPEETIRIYAAIVPSDATDKRVIWSSSDTDIATIDATGNITALTIGNCIITATSADNSEIEATCSIVIEPVPVAALTIDPTEWSGTEGDSFTIHVSVAPDNATVKDIEWSSSDESIATVDDNGYVSVLAAGSCIISAMTTDGSDLSAECIVTSYSGIDGIIDDLSAEFDIYNLQGTLIKASVNCNELKKLSSGVYILRYGSENRKIIVR